MGFPAERADILFWMRKGDGEDSGGAGGGLWTRVEKMKLICEEERERRYIDGTTERKRPCGWLLVVVLIDVGVCRVALVPFLQGEKTPRYYCGTLRFPVWHTLGFLERKKYFLSAL